MKVSALLAQWENHAKTSMTSAEYHLKLPIEDAARVAALGEMYPMKSEAEIIVELLHSALDDLESSMPYIPGKKIIGTDEQGDPFYEDEGLTPRFLKLTHEHLARIKQAESESA